jgi:pyruvate formate lyase activating enzyme
MSEDDLFLTIADRASRLDGVMVTGGEPTLQPDLSGFLTRVHSLGLETGIETNGSRPDVLAELIAGCLLDFIAMDIKAPLEAYPRLCGVDLPTELIRKSIALIAESGIEHQFRTTYVPALLSEADLDAIRLLVPDGSAHVIQPFVPDNALDPKLRQE